MAGFLKRLVSRLLPGRVTEHFEVDVVRPEALAYRVQPVVSIDGIPQSTPEVDRNGRFQVDGVTYRLDRQSHEARRRLQARLGGEESIGERILSDLAGEEALRTLIAASPELRVRQRARDLLERPDAPFQVRLDFDPQSGETSATLELAGTPFLVPSSGVGQVVQHQGKWFRVTPAQGDLLARLARAPAPQGERGKFRFPASMTPELLPELRMRPGVAPSPEAAAVRVSDAPPAPVVDLEETAEASLIVSPRMSLPTTEEIVRPEEITAINDRWARKGSEFFRPAVVEDPVYSVLSREPQSRSILSSSQIPDFLAGAPAGTGSEVRKRWISPELEVDTHPAEIQIEAELEPDGSLARSPIIAAPQGHVLFPNAQQAAGAKWARSGRRFTRLPSREAIEASYSDAVPLTQTDEICSYLIERESDAALKKRIRLGAKAKSIGIDPRPASKVATQLVLNEETKTIHARVSYVGAASSIPHAATRSLPKDQQFYRDGSRFQRIDHQAIRDVAARARKLNADETEDGYSFPAFLYDEVISLFSKLGLVEKSELFARWMERLVDFERIERVPLPSSLRSRWLPATEAGKPSGIRPYQQLGFNWLCFLKKYGFGGILADEMGLGKTVQVLLAVARAKEDSGRWCSLIVTAKSAMGHWLKDARDFFEGLSIGKWADLQRSVAGARPETVETKYDVLIVNYERVRSDIDYLEKLRFRFLVLDEGQRIKNPETKAHRAVQRLRAESRIAVTATPVETRLRDLWSIFDSLMKGKLGSQAEFVQRYEPRQRIDELSDRVRPFLLVRKKSMPEIELQLPGKSYRDRDCEMAAEQRRLYDSIRNRERDRVLEVTRTKPHGDAHIFSVMTRLLQVCLHPCLVDSGARTVDRSGKAEVVLDLLQELLEDPTNRVLVFSRFVEAIRLLEVWASPVLAARNAGAFTLVGATSSGHRQMMIEQFNDSRSRERVMFVSLMAGGVGINLQGANHVIHLDRWWNPAIEWQAEDRAYRMNSERPVTVHRIITLDSIEERVAEVLSQRMSLVKDVMDPQVAVEKLVTREELLRIFGISLAMAR